MLLIIIMQHNIIILTICFTSHDRYLELHHYNLSQLCLRVTLALNHLRERGEVVLHVIQEGGIKNEAHMT